MLDPSACFLNRIIEHANPGRQATCSSVRLIPVGAVEPASERPHANGLAGFFSFGRSGIGNGILLVLPATMR